MAFLMKLSDDNLNTKKGLTMLPQEPEKEKTLFYVKREREMTTKAMSAIMT